MVLSIKLQTDSKAIEMSLDLTILVLLLRMLGG